MRTGHSCKRPHRKFSPSSPHLPLGNQPAGTCCDQVEQRLGGLTCCFSYLYTCWAGQLWILVMIGM